MDLRCRKVILKNLSFNTVKLQQFSSLIMIQYLSVLQPQEGHEIQLLQSSYGAAQVLEALGLKRAQLHQTGLTNGRCCEIHYPLSQQSDGDQKTIST